MIENTGTLKFIDGSTTRNDIIEIDKWEEF